MKNLLFLPAFIFIMASSSIVSGFGVIDWGLKPNNKEQTPTPPPGSIKLLEENNGVFVGDTSRKEVFLTFDLGYEAGYTGDVLDILEQHKARAIFFLCGNYLKEEVLVKRMIDEGHLIGNHTDHHKDLPKLSREGIDKDIADFTEKFNALYTAPIKYFRPPKGRISKEVLDAANDQGLKTVMWSGAIVDWGKRPIDAVASADKICGRIHPGAILLFHISNSGMPKMLELLIPQLAEKGYTIGDPGTL